jgi:hypothetical protein
MKPNSNDQKGKRPGSPALNPSMARQQKRVLIFSAFFVLVFISLLVVAYLRPAPQAEAPVPAPSPAPATNPPAATPTAKPVPLSLTGRWLRPDGGYVLEIRQIRPDGTLDAAYFNPQPINVSRAMAQVENSATKIFVELRDTGYPGCTYNLVYDDATDQLKGVYFQAAMQESYEILFVRLK